MSEQNKSAVSADLFRFADRDEFSAEKITAPRYSYWRSVFRVFFRKKINIVLIVLLVLVIGAAFIMPNFWVYDQFENVLDAKTYNLSPVKAMAYFGENPIKWCLGTGQLGNSIMYGIFASARTSLLLAVTCSAINMTIGIIMAGGTALAMWIGEKITQNGIGNGISLLIFVGIVSNLFTGIVSSLSAGFQGTAVNSAGTSGWVQFALIVITSILMTVAVTFVELAERRVPLQIAKQTKGRRVYGGQNTRLTLKVVSVGVMPMIFAYSFLAFPGTIAAMISPNGGFTTWWNNNMSSGTWGYILVSSLLIMAFTFFYSSISFDPAKQAEQLIMQGATIPGQRGKNIRNYLQTIVSRLNLFAALFLAVLAAIPSLLFMAFKVSIPFAASSIIIAVSVALETVRTVEGEMSIRGIEMDVDRGGFM